MTNREQRAVGQLLEALTTFRPFPAAGHAVLAGMGNLFDLTCGEFVDPSACVSTQQYAIATYGLEQNRQEVINGIWKYGIETELLEKLGRCSGDLIDHGREFGSTWYDSDLYRKVFQRYDIDETTEVFFRNADGSTRWTMGLSHRRRKRGAERSRKMLRALLPHIDRGLRNLQFWGAALHDSAELLARVDERIVAVRNGKIAGVSGGAQAALGLDASPESRNLYLADLLRCMAKADGPGSGRVEWQGADGRTYRLAAVHAPALGTRFVRLLPTAEPTVDDARAAQRCGLSPRQCDVFALLARGLADKQIARELGISYDTARAHVRAIFSRLRVSNRMEAVNAVRGTGQV